MTVPCGPAPGPAATGNDGETDEPVRDRTGNMKGAPDAVDDGDDADDDVALGDSVGTAKRCNAMAVVGAVLVCSGAMDGE